MRLLLRNDAGEFILTKDWVGDESIPPYAILSHTWGADGDETTYEDFKNGTGKDKPGYQKIQFCGEQARRDGLLYFWIDTCCIDKSSSAELTEAINSMYRWYHHAARCYVYLSDVSVDGSLRGDPSSQPQTWISAFQHSRWFTRGWTLQELIAPASVEFFSAEGERLGDRQSLEQTLYEITGIAIRALRGSPLYQFSVKERMLWAENRQTKREEDAAYSLLGIFDIHMPLIYGEGRRNAFGRLQREIAESLKDKSPPLLPEFFGEQPKQRHEAYSALPFRLGPNVVDRHEKFAWMREESRVSNLLDQIEREYECVRELKHISSPNDGDTDESIAWFVKSTKCRLWMTNEYAKLLCYLVPHGFDATPVISRFLQGLRSPKSTSYYAIAYVDLSKYEAKSSIDVYYHVIRSLVFQLLARSRQRDQVLDGLFREGTEHDANDFWQLANSPNGKCSLNYLKKALTYVISHLGNETLSLIVINASRKVVRNVCRPLLDLLNPNIGLGARVRTLLCTYLEDDVLDIVEKNLTFSLEDEVRSCTSSLKFQEWEQRLAQVEPPLEGSDEWVWTHPAFESWRASGGVLWITGKPGSGKSTIARMITERIAAYPKLQTETCDASETENDGPVVVAGFFYSARLGVTAMGHDYMLRSILYQVLSQNQALYRHFQGTYRKLIQEQYGSSTWTFKNWRQGGHDHDALNLTQDADRPVSWNLEALEGIFEKIVEAVPADQTEIYCILDGFDESDEGSVSVSWHDRYMSVRRRTLLWLTELSVRRVALDWLRIIVLSRPTADIKMAQRGFHNIVVEEHNQPDIEKIVNAGLQDISDAIRNWESLGSTQTLGSSGSRLNNWEDHPGSTSTTLRSIRERILERANHTILWVKLVLRELQMQLGKSGAYTLDDVDRALNSLPEGLEELYKELISRLFTHRSEAQLIKTRHMLMWACFAKRPLSLLEFQDAIAITSWKASSGLSFAEHLNRNRIQLFDHTNLAPIKRDIIDSCGCLLEFGSSSEIDVPHVQVTHQTVLDFITRQDRAARPLDWSYSEAESQISSAINIYLNHCTESERQFPELTATSTFYEEIIMPIVDRFKDRPLLHYILQYRQAPSSAPSWLGNGSIPLHLRNVLAAEPTSGDLSARDEDIDVFLASLVNEMRQGHELWKTFKPGIWSMETGEPNGPSQSRNPYTRLDPESTFSGFDIINHGPSLSRPETSPSPWDHHFSPWRATVNRSPIESRATSQSSGHNLTLSGNSSQNSHKGKRCFKCHQPGHIKRDCPQRTKNDS